MWVHPQRIKKNLNSTLKWYCSKVNTIFSHTSTQVLTETAVIHLKNAGSFHQYHISIFCALLWHGWLRIIAYSQLKMEAFCGILNHHWSCELSPLVVSDQMGISHQFCGQNISPLYCCKNTSLSLLSSSLYVSGWKSVVCKRGGLPLVQMVTRSYSCRLFIRPILLVSKLQFGMWFTSCSPETDNATVLKHLL